MTHIPQTFPKHRRQNELEVTFYQYNRCKVSIPATSGYSRPLHDFLVPRPQSSALVARGEVNRNRLNKWTRLVNFPVEWYINIVTGVAP